MESERKIIIRAKVVSCDANPHGAAIKVEVNGFDPVQKNLGWSKGKKITKIHFWIHRLDQPETVVNQ